MTPARHRAVANARWRGARRRGALITSTARPERGGAEAGVGQASHVRGLSGLGDLTTQADDLLMLGGQLRDGLDAEGLQLGDGLVPGGDAVSQLGVLCLEPFDLSGPGVKGLARVALGLKATLELFAEVLVRPGRVVPSRFFFG